MKPVASESVSVPEQRNSRLCESCFTKMAPGTFHSCQSKTAVHNLVFLAIALGSLQSEQIAAAIIRNKMTTEGIDDGETFKLSTGGNPLVVKVGTPDNKHSRRSVKQISVQLIKELQIILELSQRKTKDLVSALRKGMESRIAVEEGVFEKLSKIEDSIASFYDVQEVIFKSTGGLDLKRNLVYVKDTSELVLHLISQRCLDPFKTLVRISLDSGGEFMKVIVNVFEPDQSSGMFLDSGVQRCQILAITEDIPESNTNLRIILEKLELSNVKFSAAFDLKCANACFGLSAHSGKFACLWCEGEAECESGKLRTLGSLDFWHKEYVMSGSNKLQMQKYKNVINQRVLYLDEDPETLIQHLVPPPELHILIGFVSLITTALMDLMPEFDEWLKHRNILQRGYQGRGFDGNNSNSILKNLDELENTVNSSCKHLYPLVQTLKDFRAIKESCFGKDLSPGFEKLFVQIRNSFMSAQEVAMMYGKKISLTWKVHILLCHVEPFLAYHRCGLGRFAEQTGEDSFSKQLNSIKNVIVKLQFFRFYTCTCIFKYLQLM